MAFTFANHAGRAVLVDGDKFHDLEALSGGTVPSDPMAALAHGDKLHDLQKRVAGRAPDGTVNPAQLGAPSPAPQKVFGIGLNYKTHAADDQASDAGDAQPTKLESDFDFAAAQQEAESAFAATSTCGGGSSPRSTAW